MTLKRGIFPDATSCDMSDNDRRDGCERAENQRKYGQNKRCDRKAIRYLPVGMFSQRHKTCMGTLKSKCSMPNERDIMALHPFFETFSTKPRL